MILPFLFLWPTVLGFRLRLRGSFAVCQSAKVTLNEIELNLVLCAAHETRCMWHNK